MNQVICLQIWRLSEWSLERQQDLCVWCVLSHYLLFLTFNLWIMALDIASKGLLWALSLKHNASLAIRTVAFQIPLTGRLLLRGKLLKPTWSLNIKYLCAVLQWLIQGSVYPGGEWFSKFVTFFQEMLFGYESALYLMTWLQVEFCRKCPV